MYRIPEDFNPYKPAQKAQANTVYIFCRISDALTHYQTMPHFDALKIYSCKKHCEKKRNCL